ncbi:MAG TPA: type II toxin-antitoxin system ParD family antitoxin [Thermomicrobiales bacterium]|nr:type II toxin-antitoxin system ParD family antitoxin [Thermomicrobiales bacterium]
MSVTLAPEVQDRIRSWIDSGQYPDADTVVLDALQLLEERNQARFLKLRELVRAGFESGDPVELTPELWDELEREAEEAYQRGELPDPDVCP